MLVRYGVRKYTTEEVIKEVGIPLSTLKSWILRGFIKPEEPSTGKRQRSYYGGNGIMHLKILRALSDHKLPLEWIHDIHMVRNDSVYLAIGYINIRIDIHWGQREGKTRSYIHRISEKSREISWDEAIATANKNR